MSVVDNPDGTKAIVPDKIRTGKQVVFYYRKHVDDGQAGAFYPQSVTYYEEEGEEAAVLADGTSVFKVNQPHPTTITVRPTWDYRTEYDVSMKATPKNAPHLFRN